MGFATPLRLVKYQHSPRDRQASWCKVAAAGDSQVPPAMAKYRLRQRNVSSDRQWPAAGDKRPLSFGK